MAPMQLVNVPSNWKAGGHGVGQGAIKPTSRPLRSWRTSGFESELEVGELLFQVRRQPMPLQPHHEAHLHMGRPI